MLTFGALSELSQKKEVLGTWLCVEKDGKRTSIERLNPIWSPAISSISLSRRFRMPQHPLSRDRRQMKMMALVRTCFFRPGTFWTLWGVWRCSMIFITHRIHGAAIYGNMDPINIPPLCYHIYQHHGSVMGYRRVMHLMPQGKPSSAPSSIFCAAAVLGFSPSFHSLCL